MYNRYKSGAISQSLALPCRVWDDSTYLSQQAADGVTFTLDTRVCIVDETACDRCASNAAIRPTLPSSSTTAGEGGVRVPVRPGHEQDSLRRQKVQRPKQSIICRQKENDNLTADCSLTAQLSSARCIVVCSSYRVLRMLANTLQVPHRRALGQCGHKVSDICGRAQGRSRHLRASTRAAPLLRRHRHCVPRICSSSAGSAACRGSDCVALPNHVSVHDLINSIQLCG